MVRVARVTGTEFTQGEPRKCSETQASGSGPSARRPSSNKYILVVKPRKTPERAGRTGTYHVKCKRSRKKN